MSKQTRIKFIKWCIDLNERIFFERRLRKYYKVQFPHAKQLETVIDVGANKGQSIDFFLTLNPSVQIYALEPNPALFALLQEKYGSLPNIHIFNLAVSNKSGSRMFFENVFDYTSSFEELDTASAYLKKKADILGVKVENIISKKYPVAVTTLHEFINDHIPDQKIDILKIDTEGHEYYCLEGLFPLKEQNRVNYIQLEHHLDDMYKNKIPYEKIEHILEANRFRAVGKIKHGFGSFDEMVYKHISI